MLALAQDILAAGIALAAYAFGTLIAFWRCQHLAPPPLRPGLTISEPSNDNEARHDRAASGR